MGVSTILRLFTQIFHLKLKIYLIFTPVFQRFCSWNNIIYEQIYDMIKAGTQEKILRSGFLFFV